MLLIQAPAGSLLASLVGPRCCSLSRTIETHERTSVRLRQFPLYSKTAPPPVLKDHFKEEVFKKSQAYGKDKAKFALFSGLYKQAVDSSLLQFGFYSWSWNAAGSLIQKLGYGPQYQVRRVSHSGQR